MNMNRSDPTILENAGTSVTETLNVEDVIELQTIERTTYEESTPRQEEISSTATLEGKPAHEPGRIPSKFRHRNVSGRYRSGGFGFQLELRVDVDGKRPMRRISGDFYQVQGSTTTYFGSFIVDSPTINTTPGVVIIQGVGSFTWTAGAPRIRVTIPRRLIFQPTASATVQFFTLANQPGASYLCQFVSAFFRTLQIETDRVADVTAPLFQHYNTGSLPSGGPARDLSVVSAYAEAGIEMQPVPPGPVVDTSVQIGGESDVAWSDSELHAAMVANFSQWSDDPQWKVWELAAELHELGPNLLGIMFDYGDQHQRQACAVFYAGLAGTTTDQQRLQLYTYVHELGHCFNLMHAWQKSMAIPPQADRPQSLSWMNYPWLYPPTPGAPGNPNAFWAAFPFQFDDPELIHLRHGFRNNVIMGGDNFQVGAAVEVPETFDRPVEDNTGLNLELSVSKQGSRFLFGEPVTINVKLTSKNGQSKAAHPYLHPSAGLLQIGICDPAGTIKTYRPIIEHCVAADQMRLDNANPSYEVSVYCGFGKDGFYFDRTGFYQVRAVYTALDGSKVVSNVLRLRVAHPVTAEDEDVADLFFGRQQGTLLYLLGSDSEHLKRGNDAFNEVLEKHPDHPLAEYVRLIHGINASRTFKQITPDKKLVERKVQNDGVNLLSSIVDNADKGKSPIDPLTIRDNVLTTIVRAQRDLGDMTAAAKTEKRIKVKPVKAAKAA
jgi:hypothetical protein